MLDRGTGGIDTPHVTTQDAIKIPLFCCKNYRKQNRQSKRPNQ